MTIIEFLYITSESMQKLTFKSSQNEIFATSQAARCRLFNLHLLLAIRDEKLFSQGQNIDDSPRPDDGHARMKLPPMEYSPLVSSSGQVPVLVTATFVSLGS